VRSAADVVEAVWSGVTDRTRVLFLSHVTSPTALVLPVEALCRRARAAGILTVVDGAHGPGHVTFDVHALGADAYAGNCHKWMCAPKGAGFLWLRPELHDQVDALVIGWGYAEPDAAFVERNEWQGTRDPAAYLAVPAALDFLTINDWDRVRAECHDLASCARARLAELTGMEPLQPDSEAWFGQMVTARLPDGCDAERIGLRLADEHAIEVNTNSWNGDPHIRVSVQGYNDEGDLERLLAVLPGLLASERAL
jgi:isopenicillin-N epimerase